MILKEVKWKPIPSYGGKKWKCQMEWRMKGQEGTTKNGKDQSKWNKNECQDIGGS